MLFAKPAGREAKLSHMATPPWEPAWAGMLTLANGTAERRSSEGMLKIKAKVTASLPVRTKPMIRPIMWPIFAPSTSLPDVTQNNGITKTGKSRGSAIENGPCHQRYGMPQSRRAMIECIFGWGKQHGTMRKTNIASSVAFQPISCST